jgi:tRNA-dihydrouridine synthase B
VHGRTREDLYQGEADYGLIAEIKSELRIPVLANGDIDSPEKAAAVLRETGADAVMIGRAAQGRPWIFREIAHFLAAGEHLPEPGLDEVRDILLGHLEALYAFYGEAQGLRIARKHLGWYARDVQGGEAFRTAVNAMTTAEAQTALARDWFEARAAGLVLDRAA